MLGLAPAVNQKYLVLLVVKNHLVEAGENLGWRRVKRGGGFKTEKLNKDFPLLFCFCSSQFR